MPLWNLLPSAASFVSKAVNKPKPIKMNDKYLKAFTANLRGEKISGDVRQKALEAESKVIGKRTGTALRNIQATEATPAQKTQAAVDLYRSGSEAVGGASDRASRLQEERNVGIDTQRRGVEEYLAKTKDRISMENELREDDWKKDMISSGVGLLAGGITTGLQDSATQKALEVKGQQDIAGLKALNIPPENMTPEGITHMVEQGTITVEMAKELITRKPEKEKVFKAPDIIKEPTLGGKIQEYEIDPKTGERIPFGKEYSRRAPTKPTVNSLGSWQEYAKELGVPEETIKKAKSYRTVKDLTDDFETLQWKKENLADIDTAIASIPSEEEIALLSEEEQSDVRAKLFTAEYLIGNKRLPYGGLETEKINILRELDALEKGLGITKEKEDKWSIYKD